MQKTDCLIIGYYDTSFPEYVRLVRSMGEESGAFRDLNLAYIDYEGSPHRSMDLLNRFHANGKGGAPFHNCDFLWPTISYLASYIHQRGFSFDYVNLPHFNRDRFRDKLRELDLLSVALTTTHYISPDPILELIGFIREHNAQAKIIVGGPYIYGQSQMLDEAKLRELFAYLGADIYVIQQMGEATLAQVLAALKNGHSLQGVPNIAYRQSDPDRKAAVLKRWLAAHPDRAEAVTRRAQQRGHDADAGPKAPAGERLAEAARRWQAALGPASAATFVRTAAVAEDNPLAENRINYRLFPRADLGEFVSLWTAKSCPFACAFCGFPGRAGPYNYLPVETIEQELHILYELGVRHLNFLDDTFNVPKARFKDLMRMMIRNRFGFTWNSFYRSDHGDAEAAELMAQAGCRGVFLGVESGSDFILERMNKSARRADYLRTIPLLKQAGILTHANFVVGFPGETYQTAQESVDLIEEAAPDTYRAQLWYCDPVTPVWQQREQYGIRGSAFSWAHTTMDYRTAADLVDRMFVCVENSTWLPQHSFEQWSMLYLQYHGMSGEGVRSFMRYFNAAVKEKLLYGAGKPVSAELIAGLAQAARFDREAPPGDPAGLLAKFSGAAYQAAEAYVYREYAGAKVRRWFGEAPAAHQEWETMPWASEGAADAGEAVALAALALALLEWRQQDELTLVLAGDGTVVPLRLPAAAAGQTGSDYVAQVTRKLLAARAHAAFALAIVTNPLRMAQGGVESPPLEVAVVVEGSLPQALRDYPTLERGLRLALEVVPADGWGGRLLSRRGLLNRAEAGRLATRCGVWSHTLGRDPDRLLDRVEKWDGGLAMSASSSGRSSL